MSQQLCDETVIGCWFPCLGTVIGHGYRAGLLPAMVPDQSLELSHPQMELQGPHLGVLPQGLNGIPMQQFPQALTSEKSAAGDSPVLSHWKVPFLQV